MNKILFANKLGALIAVFAVSACSALPGVPATIAEPPTAPADWKTALPADSSPVEGDWLEQFGSERLSVLVDEAVQNNLDLAAASARFEAAQHSARADFGTRLPRLEFQANPLQYNSVSGIDGGGGSIWGLVASWEVDLWGRMSARAGSSYADFVAAAADLEAARLSIAAGIVSGWARLCGATAQQELAEKELEIREQALALTKRRFNSGLSTSLDIRLAQAAHSGALAGIAAASREQAVLARDMEVMLGRYPSALLEGQELPVGLPPLAEIASPMELLSRRPDIAAAEARLEASGLRAKEARAAMWPIINLRIRGGGSDKWTNFLDPYKMAADILLSLSAPIFRGGELRARAQAANAFSEVAAVDYAKIILNAWREVENARAAETGLLEEEIARSGEVEQAIQAESLANQQYRQGLISIFDLINAQTRSIAAKRALIRVRTERVLNRASYHRAIGNSKHKMVQLAE